MKWGHNEPTYLDKVIEEGKDLAATSTTSISDLELCLNQIKSQLARCDADVAEQQAALQAEHDRLTQSNSSGPAPS